MKPAPFIFALFFAVCLGAESDGPKFAGPFGDVLMSAPRSREASGLAASRRTEGLLWTHSDSGGENVLYALAARDGSLRGRLRLEGVRNTDWEELAAFEMDGRAWLLVADTGDNAGARPSVSLHLVAEPDSSALAPGGDTVVRSEFSITFVYEDGARDCEAVAVDATERMVYLVTKRENTPRLYRLPLVAPIDVAPVVAQFVGLVPQLPQPQGLQNFIRLPNQAYRGEPTALDFSADGKLAALLTYGDLLLFPRADGETWADALTRSPIALPDHRLPQAEAVCFRADGQELFLCSERSLRLLRYERR